MIPPSWLAVWRWWRLTMLTPRTSARPSVGRTSITSPLRPLSRPVSTITLSPFLILAAITQSPSPLPTSQDLRRERNDLHVVLGAQLARHRPEDAGAHRFRLVVDQHGGVAVEAEDRAVGTADVLADTHHHGLHDVALLHLAARNRFLDRHDNDVADGGVAALGPAQHLDTHDTACTGIIGHVEVGLHLNH